MLQTHDRSPLDFSWERLEGAENSLARIAGTCRNLKWAADHAEGRPNAELAEALTAAMSRAASDYEACMDDDFNTAGAVAAYFQLVTEANKYLEQAAGAVDEDAARVCAAVIAGALAQLGVELPVIEEPLPAELAAIAADLVGFEGEDVDAAAEAILAARAEARADPRGARGGPCRKGLGRCRCHPRSPEGPGPRHRGHVRRFPHQAGLARASM